MTTAIDFERTDNELVVSLKLKELTENSPTEALIEAIMKEYLRDPRPAIVMDLANVRFVDSAGFLMFLNVRRRARLEQLDLRNVCPKVKHVFEVCGLSTRPCSETRRPLLKINDTDLQPNLPNPE